MEPFAYDDLKALGTPLPYDVAGRKQYGDFEGALRLIDAWLLKDISGNLRSRLRVEREILRVLPEDYPYSFKEAFREASSVYPDLTPKRFRALQDDGRIDWIYVNGKEHFISSTAGTLRREVGKARRKAQALAPGSEFEEGSVLQESIRRMQRDGADTWRFRVRMTLRIHEDAFRKEPVKVYLPVVCGCDYVSDIELISVSPQEYELSPEDAPIRTICYKEDLIRNHDFHVEYAFTVRSVYYDLWSEEALEANRRAWKARLSGGSAAGASPDGQAGPAAGELSEGLSGGAAGDADAVRPEDLSEMLPHIVFTPFLRDLAEQITKDLNTPLEKVRAIYDYITTKVRYSYVRSYCTIDNLSEYALLNGKGDCGLQALSFIALCRICAVPARWQSGNESLDGGVSAHDWAQVYLEPWGWLYCDPSYGGGAYQCGAPIRRRHYLGNLDPFRVPSCTAFQVQLAPPMRYWRADPYDNQSGEVEFEDGSLSEHEFTTTKELVSAERIG